MWRVYVWVLDGMINYFSSTSIHTIIILILSFYVSSLSHLQHIDANINVCLGLLGELSGNTSEALSAVLGVFEHNPNVILAVYVRAFRYHL